MKNMRKEKDSLGELPVPQEAYHGIFTERVLDNFHITQKQIPFLFLKTYIRIKKIYAKVNAQGKKLDDKKALFIEKACDELLGLDKDIFMKMFPIDIIQSGGGTSTNMLVNEVIANMANEIAGYKKGSYFVVHPNDHVNMSSSSNDTFPGVIKVTSAIQIESLLEELDKIEKVLIRKTKQFGKIKKVGRTHLQDALTITAGDEFSAYTRTIEKNKIQIDQLKKLCYELPFGGTALGSMQNITPKIRKGLIKEMEKEFGFNFRQPKNYFEAVSTSSDLEKVANTLGSLATDLIKIANDLRLLTSGPRAGISEIILPEVQAGSSIMPGKVNPSILEALQMICFQVKGLQTTVDLATMHAQLQLQAFMPVIGFALFDMFELLTNGLSMLQEKCLSNIKINKEQAQKLLDQSFVYATDYSEKLGYATVASLVKKAYAEKKNLKDLLEKEQ